jgi:F0F1-type ATP synthase assembly protein I
MGAKNQKKNKEPKPRNRWIALTGAGIQMGAVIFACAYFGKKLDTYFNTETAWFTIGLILFGIFASMYLLITQLKNLDKTD